MLACIDTLKSILKLKYYFIQNLFAYLFFYQKLMAGKYIVILIELI